MDLDHGACYRIIQARDARYDGRLFVGVKTTGVYCRPICPARTPSPQNVAFYPSAAAAHGAGFRPCLRCRPEVAPELAAWRGSASTVTRALRLIEGGTADASDIEALASRLGIGARQLRRLFAKHVGASPGAVLRTRRMHLARQLMHETGLPMADVALAAGFGSVRRFNEVFRDLFGRAPAALRRHRVSGTGADVRRGFTIRLAYTPPYAWDDMLSFLAQRAAPGVEVVSGDTYARSIFLAGQHAVIAISPIRAGALALRVHGRQLEGLPTIVRRVRGMFDLGVDSRAVDAHLGADSLLAPLVARRPGLRIAGAWDGFELATRAILGQQITVSAARGLAGRLIAACGGRLDDTFGALYPGVTHLFPLPAAVALAVSMRLGVTGARMQALASLAAACETNPSILAQHPSLDDSIRTLRSLPGIGEWTAHYIAMRQLREPDAFPATDVALLRAAGVLMGHRMSSEELLARAERWRPWRAYGAAHLWASLIADAVFPAETQVA